MNALNPEHRCKPEHRNSNSSTSNEPIPDNNIIYVDAVDDTIYDEHEPDEINWHWCEICEQWMPLSHFPH